MARRAAMGFTQESFARELEVDDSTVRGWESGRHAPQPQFRKRIAAALQVSLAELDDLLNGQDLNVGRRSASIETSTTVDLPVAEVRLAHVDPSVAGLLQQRVELLSQQYDHVPSTSLLAETTNLYGQITYLPSSTGSHEAKERLHAAAAAVALLMGQVLWDATARRDHAGALSYLAAAVRHAETIGDTDTAALAHLRSGMIDLYGQRKLTSAAARFDKAAHETRSPSLRVFVLMHRAEVHAFRGDLRECERVLRSAERLLDRSHGEDRGADLVSDRTFERMAGSCYLQLGRYSSAIEHLEAAQGLRKKSSTIVLANLSTANSHGGDLDAAATHLHAAIDELERTRSGGGLKLAAEATQLLARRRYPRSQEVQDRLLSLMAS
ncbi:helix-turn-helix domain-containing protein [Glycomyces dulcitolivorans]|uniref:helix-turn-helix domain-containing protein n=1 Tax=Glycomyces dulcitolivorans TaxID=2200759 RepID=UPI0018E4EA39|nr:helix-turn-helix transcriptional regulator [Glycomyces dulcitolivorans]